MRIRDIMEVAVVGKEYDHPLKDSDTVKVYHGTSSLDFVITAVKRGFTGDTYADRIYSYEANNNPKGLFVTPDFFTAKYFGQYVIEFHAQVKELESPVWPNGSFTVQGGMTGVFSDKQERELERMRQREKFTNSDMEYIRNSDRPELAAIFLASGERQALFVGSVNPKSVKAIWVPSDPNRDARYQTLIRLKPEQFLKKLKSGIKTSYSTVTDVDRNSDIDTKTGGKLVLPRERISIDEFIDRLIDRYSGRELDRDYVIGVLFDSPDYITRNVWSDAQAEQLRAELEQKYKRA